MLGSAGICDLQHLATTCRQPLRVTTRAIWILRSKAPWILPPDHPVAFGDRPPPAATAGFERREPGTGGRDGGGRPGGQWRREERWPRGDGVAMVLRWTGRGGRRYIFSWRPKKIHEDPRVPQVRRILRNSHLVRRMSEGSDAPENAGACGCFQNGR